MPAKFSAQDIYEVMHPGKNRKLTQWQAEAVEKGSLTGATLVVAGAGSGKTELMAVRVLWLVANGYALPEQILGLTFTRKAASELSKRVYDNLLELKKNSEMWPAELGDDFTQPNISTYNSYANSLFRDYSVGLGYEAESTLLTDAGAYQLASEVVVKDGESIVDNLEDIELSLNTIVSKVISLAASMNDNLSSGTEVESFINQVLSDIANLPKTPGGALGENYKYYLDLIADLRDTPALAQLAQHYRDEKQRLGYVDYSDQVVLAERAARNIPDVKVREQQRFKSILLDEYQDTSVLQTRMLSTLYFGCAVFAVGDPNQSIYGWRGASASNISSFGKDFGVDGHFDQFELPTSWRNPKKVLELANYLALDLATPTSYASAADAVVKPIELKPASYAVDGSISASYLMSSEDESRQVAAWFAEKVKKNPESTAALLLRTKTEMARYVEELQNIGLDAQVVGLGGLLELPEIVDLVSALKVVHSPDSGTELLRLLTGARWRIGAKDIQRLHRFAKWLNKESRAHDEFASEDALSLVDALDQLREPYFAEKSRIPEPGLSRMLEAANLFANLRKHTGLPLVQFVRMVEQELWLDIEVMANPRRRHPMANLNAFANIVAGYAGSNRKPYLGAFLTWLQFANERERFEPPTPTPEKGVVQVLTIHAAKGLEWDYVAIASLNEGTFPSAGNGNPKDWLSIGIFPWPLRGDSSSLPEFKYKGVSSQKDLNANQKLFEAQVSEHLLREELRLMYVAVTRPKAELLLTGSHFNSTAAGAKRKSQFYEKALERADLVTVVAEVEVPDKTVKNSLLEKGATEQWPLDPLGMKHASEVKRAAEQTSSAIDDKARRDRVTASLLGDIELLLTEQSERLRDIDDVALPVRVSASKFKDFVSDTDQEVKRQQRPVPSQPYKETLAGTLFHSKMEQTYIRKAALGDVEFDLVDVYVPDLALHRELIEKLDSNFAQSRWAKVEPLQAEIEIQVAIENNIFVCKIDAVFASPDADFDVEIVDWKTGLPPSDDEDLANRSLQLALYRMAYSRLFGIEPDRISCSLYFVQEQEEVRVTELLSEAQLLERWNQVPD